MLNFTWWALFSSDCVQVSVEDTRPPERGPPVEESQAEQDRQQEFDSDEQWEGGQLISFHTWGIKMAVLLFVKDSQSAFVKTLPWSARLEPRRGRDQNGYSWNHVIRQWKGLRTKPRRAGPRRVRGNMQIRCRRCRPTVFPAAVVALPLSVADVLEGEEEENHFTLLILYGHDV